MARRRQLPLPPPHKDRETVLADAMRAANLPAACESMNDLVVVPTGCYGIDAATCIGGIPVGLITVLFGESQSGKTTLALMICRAFLEAGGCAVYIDAEHRLADSDYAAMVLGFVDDAGYPLPKEQWPKEFSVLDKDCMFFEDAHESLMLLGRQSRKLAEQYPWYPGAVMIVDSLDSMVPKSLLKDLRSDSGKVDQSILSGRTGQISAARTRDFLNVAAKVAAISNMSVVSVHQEASIPGLGQAPPIPYPRGGKAVEYVTSMMIRLTRNKAYGTGYYYAKRNGGGKDEVYGTLHNAEIRKTSVGSITGDGGRFVKTAFFGSNGRGPSRPGIDTARDLLETALNYDVLQLAGASIKFGDETFARSFEKAHALLASSGAMDPATETSPAGPGRVIADALLAEIDRRNEERLGPIGISTEIGED